VGTLLGKCVGISDDLLDGPPVTSLVGSCVGEDVGTLLGKCVGISDGLLDGPLVTFFVGGSLG